jgi:hypothetical protein
LACFDVPHAEHRLVEGLLACFGLMARHRQPNEKRLYDVA